MGSLRTNRSLFPVNTERGRFRHSNPSRSLKRCFRRLRGHQHEECCCLQKTKPLFDARRKRHNPKQGNCRHASVKQFSEQTLIGVAALCITATPNHLVTSTRRLGRSQNSSPSSGRAPAIAFLSELFPSSSPGFHQPCQVACEPHSGVVRAQASHGANGTTFQMCPHA
jgi:hypothetical protein